MTTTAKTLRSRNMTAAKRSLKLIQEAAAQHLAALEAGEVPGSSFTASIAKYEQALTALATLAALADGTAAPDPGLIEVRRDDVADLASAIHHDLPGVRAGDDSPLGRLLAATATADGPAPTPAAPPAPDPNPGAATPIA